MNLKAPKLIKFIIAGSVLLMAGCSKTNNKTKTKADYLTSASWKFSTAGLDQDNNGTIDITAPTSLVEACLTDNILTFKSDKSGTIDEGPTKCNTSDQQLLPFTWELSNNDTQLTLSTSIAVGIGNDAKIVELTESRFVLSKTLTVAPFPVPVPVVVVLVH